MNLELVAPNPSPRPSVTEEIQLLIARNFFDSPRSSGDLRQYFLAEYSELLPHSHLSSPLRRASQSGRLHIYGEKGQSKLYWTPPQSERCDKVAAVDQTESKIQQGSRKKCKNQAEIIRSFVEDGFLSKPRTPEEMRRAWKDRTGMALNTKSFNVAVGREAKAGTIIQVSHGYYTGPSDSDPQPLENNR